jgi:Transcriptional antiterminator
MKIFRVLNNNCIIVLDDNQNEMILFGNGIGYAKKPEQEVDKTKISKIFVLEDQKKVNHFEELLHRVPAELIDISETLIEYAHDYLKLELNEIIHVTLPDHLDSAIENFKQGIVLHNTLLLEIKKFYQKEFDIGQKALFMMKEKTGMDLPLDEAGFIAMHFVNAQTYGESNQTRAIIMLVDEMNHIIFQTFGRKLSTIDKDSLIYCRYMTHLKFFAQRILSKSSFVQGNSHELNEIIRKYKKEYSCSQKVCEFVEEKYGYAVSEEEVIYLTVHLVQIVNRKKY